MSEDIQHGGSQSSEQLGTPGLPAASESFFVDTQPEPFWRPLLRFGVVTAMCITLFLVVLVLGFLWLQSVELGAGCWFRHGVDLPQHCYDPEIPQPN